MMSSLQRVRRSSARDFTIYFKQEVFVRKLSFPFLLIFISLACAVPNVSTPQPLPTFDPNSMQTAIVETALAAQSQTEVSLPTSTITPTVTRTPSHTPTSTPTFIFLLPSFTPIPSITPTPTITLTSEPKLDENGEPEKKKGDPFAMTGKEWTCSVYGTFPPQNYEFKPKTKFKVEWNVFNSGTKSWPYYGMDMVYSGGFRPEGTKVRDFVVSVPSGGKIGLQATFITPKNPGEYSTYFFITVGKTTFCQMKYTFYVVET